MTKKMWAFEWIFLAAMAFVSLAGCGKSNAGGTDQPTRPTHRLDGLEYATVGQGTLTHTAGVSGTGSIVFVAPLAAIGSDNGYDFTIALQDGGHVTLHANASESLAGGVEIRFTRAGQTLRLETRGPNDTFEDQSRKVTHVNASQPIAIKLDVHNSHGDIVSMIGGKRVNAAVGAAGTGKYWGFALSNASLTTVKLSAPNFPH